MNIPKSITLFQEAQKLSPGGVGTMYQAGTLLGNPLAMTAGIAALSLLREEKSW